ncbi:hypothetical protein NIES2107_40590 [Nostoc carneum NIES-2107]|nr:hypothetical protein NIES2107_40590 [Nostoc carneum NIES-2107]
MSKHIKLTDSELFLDLPEEEQATIVGGISSSQFAFFFQMRRIISLAGSQASISTDGQSLSLNQQSNAAYISSEITIGVNPSFFAGGSIQSRNRRFNSFLRLLWSIMS